MFYISKLSFSFSILVSSLVSILWLLNAIRCIAYLFYLDLGHRFYLLSYGAYSSIYFTWLSVFFYELGRTALLNLNVLVYGHFQCRLCLVKRLAAWVCIVWTGSQGTPCWDCLGGMARAVPGLSALRVLLQESWGGYKLGGPGTFGQEGALGHSTQVLPWGSPNRVSWHNSWSWSWYEQRYPRVLSTGMHWCGNWGQDKHGLGSSRALCPGGPLASYLKPKWWAWSALSYSVSVSTWHDG